MADREYFATVRRHIAAPPALVWALVADTNRWDRASGLTPGIYEYQQLVPGDEASRTRVGIAREMGIRITWIEPPYEWVEGRYVRGERKFLSGPVTRGGFRVELTPDGEGTMVEARSHVAAAGPFGTAACIFLRARFAAALERYVGAIEALLTGKRGPLDYHPEREPAVAAARRALITAPTDAITSGRVSPIDAGNFEVRARRFGTAPVDPAVRSRLLEHVRSRPDEELTQMRPFELARAWDLDRREVLRGFLHAARAGLVDLHWQLNCPTCRVGAAVASRLADVGRQAHCEACNIAFDLDFAEHVEAVFKVSPAVRKVETALYCASSPWFRPHVFAQIGLEPGATREFRAVLPQGELLFRTLQDRGQRATFAIGQGPPAALRLTLRAGGMTVEPSGRAAPGDESAVTVTNASDAAVVLLVERRGWSADIALGSVISTLPDFLDLFATEAPATGVDLSVGALTLLFSDLTGSTAMYERLGDARAFAIVQEHFRIMTDAVARHRGAIVKTMGDAVMATFESPVDAFACAVEMVENTHRAHGGIGLSVKLGLHEGPCLAVRANEHLDFFGTTVNVAARLQAQAHANQIVVMRELLEHPDIARVVRERGMRLRHFDAHLKGIREVQKLVEVDVGVASDAGTEPEFAPRVTETG
jgi:class 3 adenylate cyclase